MRPKWLSCSHFTLSTGRQNCIVFKSSGLDANRLYRVTRTGYLTLYAWVSRPFEDEMKWFMSGVWCTKQSMGGRHHTHLPLNQFLTLGTVDIVTWVILWCGGCLVHCRMFNSISSLYSLDASSSPSCPNPRPPWWQPNMSPDVAKCVPGDRGTESSLVENHCFGWIQVLEDEGNSILRLDIYSIFKPQIWKIPSLISKA